MTPLDILKAARAKIEKPECWGKHFSVNSWSGITVYCSHGAILVAGRGDDAAWTAETWLQKALDGRSVVLWNDAPERTHSDVLKAFDRAIELASQP